MEFSESAGGGLAVVHEGWFTPRKTEILWPPLKDVVSFNKLLKKGQHPEDTWKLYGVARTFYKSGMYLPILLNAKKPILLMHLPLPFFHEVDDSDYFTSVLHRR